MRLWMNNTVKEFKMIKKKGKKACCSTNQLASTMTVLPLRAGVFFIKKLLIAELNQRKT
jgi:hypothetical protein